jgi:nicotinamide-nucleotide amidase
MKKELNDKYPVIIRKLHELLTAKELRVSVAESCTGGLISSYLTLLPGSSRFFEAGVVSYSAASKNKILGLSEETIASYGVVSKEIAGEMAEGMRLLTGTDYALAITGNLGPDLLEGKSMGLVYLALSSRMKTVSKELNLTGTRLWNRDEAAHLSLQFLFEEITGKGL